MNFLIIITTIKVQALPQNTTSTVGYLWLGGQTYTWWKYKALSWAGGSYSVKISSAGILYLNYWSPFFRQNSTNFCVKFWELCTMWRDIQLVNNLNIMNAVNSYWDHKATNLLTPEVNPCKAEKKGEDIVRRIWARLTKKRCASHKTFVWLAYHWT